MIRNYTGIDIKKIIELWNRCMPYDQITEKQFIKNILLDLNFTPEGVFVYETKGEIKGFVYATKRKIPIDIGGEMDDDRGWICALAIDSDCFEIAPTLIKKAEDYICKDNSRTVFACSYTPNYLYQGINKRYSDYLNLFENLGYSKEECSVSMKINLTKYSTPDHIRQLKEKLTKQGITFTTLTPEHITSWLTFQKPSWTHRFRRLLSESMDFEKVNIALFNNEVIGCNIFGDSYSSEERFGPFGVRDDFQARGIGKVLLDECLINMKNRGLTHAWMQWATAADYVVNMYKKFGFEVVNEYIVFKKYKEKRN